MKKICTILTIHTLCFLYFSSSAQTTLVDFGSTWSYSDIGSEPPLQGSTSWQQVAYDDASWAAGNAQLGYGDGDESTVIASGVYTAYFRSSFQVTDPSAFSNLDLNLIYDDGAVIYINGTEAWRVNMPAGTITYNTFSASQSSDNSLATEQIGNILIPGTNVVSVEVHQRSSGSSDISFDFKLVGLPAGGTSVVRGPYLQKGTPNSMTIRWRTSTPTESVVQYGPDLQNINVQVEDLTPKTEHSLTIDNLTAGTQYYYTIENASIVLIAATSDLYFHTSPAPGTTVPATVWILGDCGTGSNNARNVRDAYYNYIGAAHTDLMLFLGDNAYNDGTDSEYQFALFENMYDQKLKNTVSYSCLGNHDGHSASSANQTGPYFDIFEFPTAGEGGGLPSGTEAYYSFDYGNIHFISLDSYDSDRSVGGAMYNWCEADLQNTTADWIVAFWHHPPYSKGSHDSDNEGTLVQMRNNFLPLLESYGVDLVLSGHSHSYERSFYLNGHYGLSQSFNIGTHPVGNNGAGDGRVDGDGSYLRSAGSEEGAVYITTGSAGKITSAPLDHPAMFYSVAELGSCVLQVDGNTMEVKFVRESGAIEDYFTIVNEETTCNPGDPCDDGDPCTINDQYDNQCGCLGTFEDSDGDGVCDAMDQCPGHDDNVDNNQNGIPDGCENCIAQTDHFSPNPLVHSGSGASVAHIQFGEERTDVYFTISGLNARENRKKSERFIDLVKFRFQQPGGTWSGWQTYSGSEHSVLFVIEPGPIVGIEVSLEDGYDGNAAVMLSVDLSEVNSCGTTAALPESPVTEFGSSEKSLDHITVWPNPASDHLEIRIVLDKTAAPDRVLNIYDNYGRLVMSRELSAQAVSTLSWDVHHLPSGRYTIKAAAEDRELWANFLIIR